MKIKMMSLVAAASCVALFSCEDNSLTYEQVLINHTDETINVMAGSGECAERTYNLQPGEKQVVHSARVLNAPNSCDNHHYMIMDGPDNLNDISDMTNWRRSESKNLVRCEFAFESRRDNDTTTTHSNH